MRLSPILRILTASRQAKIPLSIVKSVMINVVAKLPAERSRNVSVHQDQALLAAWRVANPAGCVRRPRTGLGKPSVPAQVLVVVWVDDGEFALRQGNSSEGVAVAQPTIQKHEKHYRLLDPAWNGKDDFGDACPCLRSKIGLNYGRPDRASIIGASARLMRKIAEKQTEPEA